MNLLRMAGGKAGMADEIIARIPPHVCYVEPFGGGAAVLMTKAPSQVEVYNDIRGDLVNFMMQVRDNAEELARRCYWTPKARKLYGEWATKWSKDGWRPEDPIERAAVFFFMQRMTFGGVPTWSPGNFGYSLVTGATAYSNACRNILNVAGRLTRVTMECLDWSDILDRYDGPQTFFYLDPPYTYGTAGEAADDCLYDWPPEKLDALVERLGRIKGKALVSVGKQEDADKFDGWRREVLERSLLISNDRRTKYENGNPIVKEYLLTNYDPEPGLFT
ncbi:MAG TPA: DNA adenine methylase [Candidatus Thermoplasmatota archaeon]|nr:DNA adenine methylase [Candidatus Thermoplasmatota archaeon]